MKCARCGSEMTLDYHRRMPVQMCYVCGYVEDRNLEPLKGQTNYERMKGMDFNETAAFLSVGLGMDVDRVIDWLDNQE